MRGADPCSRIASEVLGTEGEGLGGNVDFGAAGSDDFDFMHGRRCRRSRETSAATKQSTAVRGAEAFLFAGGRHHFGRGVSPAARAAAMGSPPGSAMATFSAEEGRRLRIFFEAAQNDALDGGVEVLDQIAWDCVCGFDCALAGEHFVQHQAERIDIAARGDFLARLLLRRHVGGRAVAEIGCSGIFGSQRGQAEVGDDAPGRGRRS